MKCSLGISNFLEEISSLSHFVVFLYFFALITEEVLSLLALLWDSSFKDGHNRGQKYLLREAEYIKKRWQEYTEELYKKDLHDPDNHDGVITHTHLEPDILECEVTWALESITTNKASGGDGIPVELFQS